MRPTTHHLNINVVRSEALFVSALQRSEQPGREQIREAIARALREFGSKSSAARVAQEFGDHPETAVVRMRWTRQVVDEVFGAARPRSPRPKPVDSGLPGPAAAASSRESRATAHRSVCAGRTEYPASMDRQANAAARQGLPRVLPAAAVKMAAGPG
jgi:hypothetical protein